MGRSSNSEPRSGTKRRRASTLTSVAILLPAIFSAGCAHLGIGGDDAPKPGPDAVCREPNEPEIRSLTLLAHLTLPHDETGRSIDIAPGEKLPEGANPPELPELYPAATWVAGVVCRCYPERCAPRKPDEPERKSATPGPGDDPDPSSAEERGTPPAAEP